MTLGTGARGARRRWAWGLAALATVAAAAPAVVPAAARADGDPASDVLLGANVFYPYSPAVAPATQRRLDSETVVAARAGFRIKIALIASPVDLGAVPSLYGRPEQYASFLDQEISFQARQPLLVVMPGGYGAAGLGAKVRAAVAKLPRPAGRTSDDLARAALEALPTLAAAAGHPFRFAAAGASGGGPRGSGSTSLALILVGAGALVLVGAGGVAVLRRGRGERA